MLAYLSDGVYNVILADAASRCYSCYVFRGEKTREVHVNCVAFKLSDAKLCVSNILPETRASVCIEMFCNIIMRMYSLKWKPEYYQNIMIRCSFSYNAANSEISLTRETFDFDETLYICKEKKSKWMNLEICSCSPKTIPRG